MGLIITLAAVVAYSGYITRQISGLRELQNNLVDRNRKDSLQLLRIQNDLNSLALAMRDMLDNERALSPDRVGRRNSSACALTWTTRFAAKSRWRSPTALPNSNSI